MRAFLKQGRRGAHRDLVLRSGAMSESSRKAIGTGAGAGARVTAAGVDLEPLPEQVVVARSRLFEDWRSATERARSYLKAAGVGEPARSDIAERAALRAATAPDTGEASNALGGTLSSMRQILLEAIPPGETRIGDDDAFLAWRLGAAFAGGASEVSQRGVVAPLPCGGGSHRCRRWRAPRCHRTASCGADCVARSCRPRRRAALGPHAPAAARLRARGWTRAPTAVELDARGDAARCSRLLVWAPSIVAAGFMLDVLPQQGGNPLEIAIAVCFGALFGWISIGFWTALLGFVSCSPRAATSSPSRAAIDKGASADRPRRAHGDRDADLRGAGRARVRGPARDPRLARARAAAPRPFHFFVLSDTRGSRQGDGGGSGLVRVVPRNATASAASSTAGAASASSARAETSPTSAVVGAAPTAT